MGVANLLVFAGVIAVFVAGAIIIGLAALVILVAGSALALTARIASSASRFRERRVKYEPGVGATGSSRDSREPKELIGGVKDSA